MSFQRGGQVKVFMTTENADGSVLCTGSVAEASTTSASVGPNGTIKGIAPLGAVTASSATSSQIMNLEGVDPVWEWEDDPFEVFGQSRKLDNPIKKKWSITLTKKGENKLFAKLADSARHGVTGSTPVLFDGLDTMPDDTGYRVYVFDGTDFAVGFHGTIDPAGFKYAMTPSGVTVQTIVINGGIWSASIPEGDASLTTAMDISQ